MVFFGVIIGIIIMAAMIYLALDKKSNFSTRLASLGAIAIMILTVIICLVMVLSDNRVPFDPSTLIVGAPEEIREDSANIVPLLFSIMLLLALFVVIAFLAFKEHKKTQSK
jgi:heme A synthase